MDCTDHIELIDKKIVLNNYLQTKLIKVSNICYGIDINKESIEYLQKKHDIPNLIVLDLNDEVPYYMNAMDVMILPSRNEGFGAVIIEAQACGVPVVGSSNGGIPEAIGDGGIVIEEGEDFEKRFAEAVVEMLKNPIEREYLRERALGFSWENIVKREVAVYEEVLKR